LCSAARWHVLSAAAHVQACAFVLPASQRTRAGLARAILGQSDCFYCCDCSTFFVCFAVRDRRCCWCRAGAQAADIVRNIVNAIRYCHDKGIAVSFGARLHHLALCYMRAA
jgi:hypothetical protein